MLKRTIVGLTLSAAILIGGSSFSLPNANAEVNEAKQPFDQITAFQSEVIPIIEEALIRQFPAESRISDTETVSVVSEDFSKQATYYYDNDNINDLKVVFLIAQENTPQMKAIRAELEGKLGDKVLFKQASQNPYEMRQFSKKVADCVSMFEIDSYSVGYDEKNEEVVAKGDFTDEQVRQLRDKFGSDALRIEVQELRHILTLEAGAPPPFQ
ncbi:hypothetical protein [Paenibacillus sp. NEAU-GSW1]|uniref:hypothetical protein n=1 Tax=Paenibacillus sp. NEAU-GSW1 TaxID=2682486 RepID=UPI0012E148AD|nr:hypothetical protein [Paenibacillus sp. NEAU-GSW1]MUT65210.1 hypothetical protein [Paenibacillus sp. NEAU-GSW1]